MGVWGCGVRYNVALLELADRGGSRGVVDTNVDRVLEGKPDEILNLLGLRS